MISRPIEKVGKTRDEPMHGMGESEVMESLLDWVLETLRESTNLDLTGYRRATLHRRLAARIAKMAAGSPQSYWERLRTDADERDQLAGALLVQVSSFFRDPIVFEIIVQCVLPAIIERRRKDGVNEIRVWCAGCATGEEAYSIAIAIYETLKDEIALWRPYVFATDLSRQALETAREGAYPRERFETTKLGILDRYFTPRGSGYEVRPFIRSMVHFSFDNVLSTERTAPVDSVFGTFDMVFCRNVLIYLSTRAQVRVLTKLRGTLVDGGHLVLGASEGIPEECGEGFAPLDRRNRIFCKSSACSTAW